MGNGTISLTVAGRRIEVDPSGTGNAWETADQETCPHYVQHEIASRILDNRLEQCACYVGLNGLRYRWRPHTPPPVITARVSGRVLPILFGILLGCVLGALIMGSKCLLAWRTGGSADPRCVFARHGYTEVHRAFNNARYVTCEYRPEIIARWRE